MRDKDKRQPIGGGGQSQGQSQGQGGPGLTNYVNLETFQKQKLRHKVREHYLILKDFLMYYKDSSMKIDGH